VENAKKKKKKVNLSFFLSNISCDFGFQNSFKPNATPLINPHNTTEVVSATREKA
jgi:hypothetical protein